MLKSKYFTCKKCHKTFEAVAERCQFCIKHTKSKKHIVYVGIKVRCSYDDCNHEQTLQKACLNQKWICSVCKRCNFLHDTLT